MFELLVCTALEYRLIASDARPGRTPGNLPQALTVRPEGFLFVFGYAIVVVHGKASPRGRYVVPDGFNADPQTLAGVATGGGFLLGIRDFLLTLVLACGCVGRGRSYYAPPRS